MQFAGEHVHRAGLPLMSEEQDELQDKIDRRVTQLRKVPSSTNGDSAYEFIFGREI